MKTSELTGAALDWAVATADGWEYDDPETPSREDRSWKPSTNWAQAGPIIERERIGIAFNGGQWVGFYMADELNEYDWDFSSSEYGPTPLIAAMRCFVAAKLGDEVEAPEELA